MTFWTSILSLFEDFFFICHQYKKLFLQLTFIVAGLTFFLMIIFLIIFFNIQTMYFTINMTTFSIINILFSVIQLIFSTYLSACVAQFFFRHKKESMMSFLYITIKKIRFGIKFFALLIILPMFFIIIPLILLINAQIPIFLLLSITLLLTSSYIVFYIRYCIALPSIFSNEPLALTTAFQKTNGHTWYLGVSFLLFTITIITITYTIHICLITLENFFFFEKELIAVKFVSNEFFNISLNHFLFFTLSCIIDNTLNFWRYLGITILITLFYARLTNAKLI